MEQFTKRTNLYSVLCVKEIEPASSRNTYYAIRVLCRSEAERSHRTQTHFHTHLICSKFCYYCDFLSSSLFSLFLKRSTLFCDMLLCFPLFRSVAHLPISIAKCRHSSHWYCLHFIYHIKLTSSPFRFYFVRRSLFHCVCLWWKNPPLHSLYTSTSQHSPRSYRPTVECDAHKNKNK